MVTMLRLAALLLLLLWETTGDASQSGFEFSVDQCFLTPNLGNVGTRKFLEECEDIGEFLHYFTLEVKALHYF